METIPIQVRLPRKVHDALRELKAIKPHMSLNALMVDILEAGIRENLAIYEGRTQIDYRLLEQSR